MKSMEVEFVSEGVGWRADHLLPEGEGPFLAVVMAGS